MTTGELPTNSVLNETAQKLAQLPVVPADQLALIQTAIQNKIQTYQQQVQDLQPRIEAMNQTLAAISKFPPQGFVWNDSGLQKNYNDLQTQIDNVNGLRSDIQQNLEGVHFQTALISPAHLAEFSPSFLSQQTPGAVQPTTDEVISAIKGGQANALQNVGYDPNQIQTLQSLTPYISDGRVDINAAVEAGKEEELKSVGVSQELIDQAKAPQPSQPSQSSAEIYNGPTVFDTYGNLVKGEVAYNGPTVFDTYGNLVKGNLPTEEQRTAAQTELDKTESIYVAQTVLEKLSPYKSSDGTYNLTQALLNGADRNDLRTVFGDETVEAAVRDLDKQTILTQVKQEGEEYPGGTNLTKEQEQAQTRQQEILSALKPYSTADGTYDINKALSDNVVNRDQLRLAGFKQGDIDRIPLTLTEKAQRGIPITLDDIQDPELRKRIEAEIKYGPPTIKGPLAGKFGEPYYSQRQANQQLGQAEDISILRGISLEKAAESLPPPQSWIEENVPYISSVPFLGTSQRLTSYKQFGQDMPVKELAVRAGLDILASLTLKAPAVIPTEGLYAYQEYARLRELAQTVKNKGEIFAATQDMEDLLALRKADTEFAAALQQSSLGRYSSTVPQDLLNKEQELLAKINTPSKNLAEERAKDKALKELEKVRKNIDYYKSISIKEKVISGGEEGPSTYFGGSEETTDLLWGNNQQEILKEALDLQRRIKEIEATPYLDIDNELPLLKKDLEAKVDFLRKNPEINSESTKKALENLAGPYREVSSNLPALRRAADDLIQGVAREDVQTISRGIDTLPEDIWSKVKPSYEATVQGASKESLINIESLKKVTTTPSPTISGEGTFFDPLRSAKSLEDWRGVTVPEEGAELGVKSSGISDRPSGPTVTEREIAKRSSQLDPATREAWKVRMDAELQGAAGPQNLNTLTTLLPISAQLLDQPIQDVYVKAAPPSIETDVSKILPDAIGKPAQESQTYTQLHPDFISPAPETHDKSKASPIPEITSLGTIPATVVTTVPEIQKSNRTASFPDLKTRLNELPDLKTATVPNLKEDLSIKLSQRLNLETNLATLPKLQTESLKLPTLPAVETAVADLPPSPLSTTSPPKAPPKLPTISFPASPQKELPTPLIGSARYFERVPKAHPLEGTDYRSVRIQNGRPAEERRWKPTYLGLRILETLPPNGYRIYWNGEVFDWYSPTSQEVAAEADT